MNQYGIDINTLEKFITHPDITEKRSKVLEFDGNSLERIKLAPQEGISIEIAPGRETTFFVEEGEATIGSALTSAGQLISSAASSVLVTAQKDSVLYAFSGPAEPSASYGAVGEPFDIREKYWGDIRSLVSREYAGKRIFCRKNNQSSLEFHCRKTEGYYVHSGKLLVRLRAGRGEDRMFTLPPGSVIFIPPGLMHQRGGLEDTIIMELSTRDDDSDSFLVEDGAKIRMPQLPEA